MSDLIERQAAIDAIEEVDWYHQNKNKDMVSGANSSEHQAWYKADDIYKTLEALPSAQLEPKRGEWLDNETSYSDDIPQTCTCSICGIRSRRPLGDFCKWCGSDMRGEKDE